MALGLAIMASMTACDDRESSHKASTAWRYLHVGETVYMGGNQWDSSTQMVCSSIRGLIDSSSHARSTGCIAAPHGTPAVVEAIIPNERRGARPVDAYVKIRAVNGKWAGVTNLAYLQPTIPSGTILLMDRDWATAMTLGSGGQDLGSQVAVEVVRFDPKRTGRQLYVRILDGPYKNSEGWMGIAQVHPDAVAEQGRYGLIGAAPQL